MRLCFFWIASVSIIHAAEYGTRRVESVRADLRSGKLVRSVIVTPRLVAPALEASPQAAVLQDAVNRIAEQQSVPANLLHSVIKVESNYNPYAVSNKGAQGLMQLIPATARRFGVNDVFNPVENINGGAKYLRYLLDLYQGDYPLALAAYNAGEGAVAKYGGVPPYKETRNYVQLVRKQLEKTAPQPAVKPVPAPVEVKPAEPRIRQIVEPDGSVRYVSN